MLSRSAKYTLALVCALFVLLSGSAYAEVFVNVQWDDDEERWKVKPLISDGGFRFDRSYQNPYGEYLGLDPGPPFHIQASIQALGSITFESGPPNPLYPFDVTVEPSGGQTGYISAGDGINFVGTSIDPIKFSGRYKIAAGNYDQPPDRQIVWSNTTFECTWHERTWNPVPFEIIGCGMTIDGCRFKSFNDDFFYLMAIIDHNPLPMYEVAIQDTRFEHFEFNNSMYPILIDNAARVSIEGCNFDSVVVYEHESSALVDVRDCGIGSVKNNTGKRNTLNKLLWRGAWVSDSGFIKTSDEVPLVISEIRVDYDSALAIGPGSVVKFLSAGGFENSGRLHTDSAVITSWQDDSHGGDTDLEPQPQPITTKWKCTSGWGINNRVGGELSLKRTDIYHAYTAINAESGITVDSCRIIDCKAYGIYIDGALADTFRVSNTEILRTINDGNDAGIYYRHDVGYQQLLDLDSVTIMSTGGPGIYIPYIGAGLATIEIDGCRIIDNDGYGIYFVSDPNLLSIAVRNSVIAGNDYNGIYSVDQYTPGGDVFIEGNLILGNGWGQYASHKTGISMPNSPPEIISNTIAYNAEVGLSVWDIDNIEQMEIANNLFFRNGDYGLFKSDDGECLFAANDFWENGTDELRYEGPDGRLYTVEEVQALGGEYATNLHLDPELVPERFGTIDNLEYDDIHRISKLADAGGHFNNYDLVGRFICPDTLNPGWHYVANQFLDTLYIVGDITDKADVGDIYRIHDFHLSATSPLVEVGRSASVSLFYDIDGENRYIDGDENGVPYVDISADEYNPNAIEDPPIRITSPSGGEFFAEGDVCKISWGVDGVSNIHIKYSSDYDPAEAVWTPLAENVDASTGSWDWTVGPDVTMKGTIRIEDASDANVFAQSNPFVLKSYVLARKVADSGLARYLPEVDSWRFGNDSALMWPDHVFNQIDYENGIDPYTNQAYPPFFANELFYNAESSDFPSWPTWVGAFGEDQCYMAGPQGRMYRTEALNAWSDFKHKWRGSCVGFGISTALAFFDSAAFLGDYPGVGEFVDLHDLDTTNARREAINRLFCHQRGKIHNEYKKANFWNTPRQTLAELKEMLRDNFVNGRMMGIGKAGAGGHVVNPFAIEPVAGQPGEYKVLIYDSETPVPDGSIDYDSLFIDSATNTWSSVAYPGWTGQGAFCFMLDSSASYLDPPVLPGLAAAKADQPFASASATPVEVYHNGLTQMLIDDGAGHVTGFEGSTFYDEIPGAVPMVTLAGAGESLPEGFALPEGGYTIDVASSENPVISTSIWDGPVVYRYSRSGVDPSQTDNLAYDTSLAVSSADAGTKTCQVACLTIGAANEKQYVIKGLTVDNGESIEFFTPDGLTFNVLNGGAGMTCGFELWSISTGGGVITMADNVPLTGGALHTVAPNWSDPSLTDIELLIDYDVDGTYDETIQLDVATSVDGDERGSTLPQRFELSQNYPNPFNPTTEIQFSLPHASHVKLEVFNIMGQKILTLADRQMGAGYHSVTFDGGSVASGVYLYRLTTDEFQASKKMMLVK